jgi:CheY-like chemotaxis protein
MRGSRQLAAIETGMEELRLLRQRVSDGADTSRLMMCETQTNVAKATRAQARIRNDQRKKKPPVNAPALVALVDDEPAVRIALTRLIRSCGFRVEAFSLGREFLRSVANHKPDCVVLDVHMPEMGGWEVQSHLRRTHPDIPVIVISGQDDLCAHARAKRSRARDYFSKPVDGDLLVGAIRMAIDSRRT